MVHSLEDKCMKLVHIAQVIKGNQRMFVGLKLVCTKQKQEDWGGLSSLCLCVKSIRVKLEETANEQN